MQFCDGGRSLITNKHSNNFYDFLFGLENRLEFLKCNRKYISNHYWQQAKKKRKQRKLVLFGFDARTHTQLWNWWSLLFILFVQKENKMNLFLHISVPLISSPHLISLFILPNLFEFSSRLHIRSLVIGTFSTSFHFFSLANGTRNWLLLLPLPVAVCRLPILFIEHVSLSLSCSLFCLDVLFYYTILCLF